MGIKEDTLELTGTELERKLDLLSQGLGGPFLVEVDGEWKFANERPEPGSGRYYEHIPDEKNRQHMNS